MNVASLELCEELYGLSDWFDTYAKYYELDRIPQLLPSITIGNEPLGVHQLVMKAPAYSLDYLLRQLPNKRVKLRNYSDGHWKCQYTLDIGRHVKDYIEHADTPEDAAAKLAIELFKQGVLTR
jgi:hypothetical protein